MKYLNALILMTGMIALWVFVQNGWRKVFREEITSDDVLADRSKCAGCKCAGDCKKNNPIKNK